MRTTRGKQLTQNDAHEVALRLDLDDRYLIMNCINESLEIVDPALFSLRTGGERDAAIVLHRQIAASGQGATSMSVDAVELARKCVIVALDLVDAPEFQSRTGYDLADAQRLRDRA